MEQVFERQLLRRQYQQYRRKAKIRIATVVCKAATFPLLGLVITGWAYHEDAWDFAARSGLAAVGLFCVAYLPLALYYRLHYIEAKRRLDALPYIPFENADHLPTDEVLVRGSEEPSVAQCEVLLRAAKEQETSKEELLRMAGARNDRGT